MKRIALGLHYEGTSWQGWQKQLHRQTVQDTLESALAKFCQHPVATVCAGRTDSGVHALGQVVHFDTEARRELFAWVREGQKVSLLGQEMTGMKQAAAQSKANTHAAQPADGVAK